MPASPSSRLTRDEDGAIIAFGVFFGVLLLGLLYYMIGLGATIYYRERMQDAADASAFASAIVHARGMNTLALINLIMAALLSVLVALRLVQALIIIAQAILYALAWLGGATAAVASALEVVRQAVKKVEKAALPIVTNVNKVLKVGGDVVRVATPLASNVSVLGKVANRYYPEVMLAVAIPPRLTLPVEDDDFDYLCGKAGFIAGELALLPLRPVIPGGLRKKLSKALSKLTEKGSKWFCDGSTPPSYPAEDEVLDYPATDAMQQCTGNAGSSEAGEIRAADLDACRQAEQDEGKSEPDEATGLCRVGQPVCQPLRDDEGWEEKGEPKGAVMPYSPHSWCGSEGVEATVSESDCRTITEAGHTYPDPETEYGKRLLRARRDCDPGKEGLYDFWWMERELDVTWEWNEAAGAWIEGNAVEVIAATPHGRPTVDRVPCRDVVVATLDNAFVPLEITANGEWNGSDRLYEPVCVIDAPRPGAPEKLNDPRMVTLRRVEVTQVLGCSTTRKGQEVKVEAINLGAEKFTEGLEGIEAPPDGTGGDFANIDSNSLGAAGETQSGNSGGDDTKPFRFIQGHRLGTSDMQIRSLSIGTKLGDTDLKDVIPEGQELDRSIHNEAVRVIGVTRWGTGESSNGLSKASEVWGRFAVAQAEYFFDTGKAGDEFASWGGWDEKGPKESGRDFLWVMNWTARMRRFRLRWQVDGESADGPSNGEAAGESSDMMMDAVGIDESLGFTPQQLVEDGPSIPCDKLGKVASACGQLQEIMRSLDGIFIH